MPFQMFQSQPLYLQSEQRGQLCCKPGPCPHSRCGKTKLGRKRRAAGAVPTHALALGTASPPGAVSSSAACSISAAASTGPRYLMLLPPCRGCGFSEKATSPARACPLPRTAVSLPAKLSQRFYHREICDLHLRKYSRHESSFTGSISEREAQPRSRVPGGFWSFRKAQLGSCSCQ